MTAIITGDIINSEDSTTSLWIRPLKDYLTQLGTTPADWEIYRGDEFQLRVSESKVLETAIHLKAVIKSIKNLDVRMGIGLGEETFRGDRVSESNGTAYQRSGRTFETLKEQKRTLSMATGVASYDRTMNLMLKLALNFMDLWSPVSAEIIALFLSNPNAPQQEIATKLNIQQSAVSQRLKRARIDLVLDLLSYYTQTLKEIRP